MMSHSAPSSPCNSTNNINIDKYGSFGLDSTLNAPFPPLSKPVTDECKSITSNTGWNVQKESIVSSWLKELDYQKAVNYFFVYDLKKKEGLWSWLIIILSTITSSLSLIQIENYQIPDAKYIDYIISGLLCIFSTLTTLMASWIKKQNYVERIKTIDRYVQEVSKLYVEINQILNLARDDRCEYTQFYSNFNEKILQILSTVPPMAPEEYKKTVYILTKYYPELLTDVWPWFEPYPDKIGNNRMYMTRFGKDVLETYDYVKYNNFCSRLVYCYYCRSQCLSKDIKSRFKNYDRINKEKYEEIESNKVQTIIDIAP